MEALTVGTSVTSIVDIPLLRRRTGMRFTTGTGCPCFFS